MVVCAPLALNAKLRDLLHEKSNRKVERLGGLDAVMKGA
jgi:hypothetical protein